MYGYDTKMSSWLVYRIMQMITLIGIAATSDVRILRTKDRTATHLTPVRENMADLQLYRSITVRCTIDNCSVKHSIILILALK